METTMQVNDQVFIANPSSGMYPTRYHQGKVVKITPSGQVDVQIGECVRRYGANGKEIAKPGAYKTNNYLDTMPFDERKAIIEQEERTKIASILVHAIQADRRITHRWSKEGLLNEVIRLETELAQARAAVEAI
jgi:hypothetical protein